MCDASAFNKSFRFPAGADVATIQHDLCKAATNHSLVMTKVWELFDMKELMQELARMTGGGQPTPVTESPFRSLLKQVQRLLQNANVITRLMQAFTRSMPDVAQYLNMALSTVNTLLSPDANNIGTMCDAVVNLIDEVPGYLQAQPYLVRVQIINSIAAELATSLDEFDDFLCDLPSMNVSMLFSKITDSDLLEEILLVDNEEYLRKTPFVCSELVRDAMLPQVKIQNMIADGVNGSYDKCIKKLMTENITIVNDLSSYLGLLGGLRDLLNSDSLASLKWLDPLRPILNGVLDGLFAQVSDHKREILE